MIERGPNHPADRESKQDDDKDSSGFNSPVGKFQADKTADNQQNRPWEEEENTHARINT